jgi:CxxC-x17-CxxC domain-containing protein
MYVDETLTCVDCGHPFPFTAGEQTFFAEKGFANKPSRCADCRTARRGQRPGARAASPFDRHEKRMFQTVCTSCGGTATVPFQPRDDRPVYCRDCFSRRPARR